MALKTLIILLFLIVLNTPHAYAYIDPGSGGYLISSILTAIGAFLAFASAVVVHFFRNIVWKTICSLWNKHRLLFLAGSLFVLSGIGAILYHIFYEPAIAPFDASLSGAHMHNASKIYDGYNLYEGKLIDMQGHVVKKWKSIYLGVIDPQTGDYYAEKYYEAPVWGRYTWDDKVVWEKNFPIHHDIVLTPKGTVITFTKEVHQYMGRDVEFDVILEFDKNGNLLDRFSLWDHLKEFQHYHKKLELDLPKSYIIPDVDRETKSIWGGHYDYYHLNSLSIVPPNAREGTHPAFRPGNWIISFRHGSMVFILDQDSKQILWRAIYNQVPDRLEGPHAAHMLDNGNILILDNGRYRKWSRIIELDPVTLKPVWEFKEKDFYSLSQGYVQQLPNGNILVTEAEKGHVFEITPVKEVVWEFYHPDKQDKTNSTDEKKWGLRQEIYRMTRYPKAMIDLFLKQNGGDYGTT
jgi:Arylsulfotransferase (ASST)